MKQKKLTDYRVLTFDVYGTLIDWESGIIEALAPALGRDVEGLTRRKILETVHELEAAQQAAHPDMLYADVLAAIYPRLVARLTGGGTPPEEESDNNDNNNSEEAAAAARAFGASVARWPAFPDTVGALRRLGRHYKLVVLSNVDRTSFSGTNAGPLGGVEFDMILTAQDIGSYKPSLDNFRYMLGKVEEAAFGAGGGDVLQTAQSQWHDHLPARQVGGIGSAWIVRPGAIMGNVAEGEEVWDFKFDTLSDMADAVERELAESKSL
ncbi:haloacid dehalogenase [Microdochium trichocladiopsis]|uniref:Haloacid dehalogenase n=1 Tax=Microdochium trichocladiopsis TaxID=1682393 RepID=A0A9P9BV31_9PEZI|nr:haloacid dehalogenase [Microdochium trichocladiopsis]KAH7038231.1 haloacid dehalogenase [Microdochium trichocladiopsis]